MEKKREKKKLFKNKTQLVIYTFLYIVCLVLFVLIGNIDFHDNSETEAKKFSNIYDLVSADNHYIFASATDVLNIINGNSGVILFGFPQNKWTNYYASILENVAKEVNLDKIYYYDFLADREESNGTYETIVSKLRVYAPILDEDVANIFAPTVVVIKDGEVLGYFDDTSIMKGNIKPEDYYTENQRGLTYELFKSTLLDYLKEG